MIRNFTPHALNFVADNGEVKLSIPSEGSARCSVKAEHYGVQEVEVAYGEIYPIEVRQTSFGDLTGLPEANGKDLFVVSLPAYQAARAAGRRDVAVPGNLVRDSRGQVIGCKTLDQPQ